jgi:hypothetical protein
LGFVSEDNWEPDVTSGSRLESASWVWVVDGTE